MVVFEQVIHKNIEITPLPGGWLVKVGCQPMVYTDKNKLIADLISYINNPQQVERDFLDSTRKNTGSADCGGINSGSTDRISAKTY